MDVELVKHDFEEAEVPYKRKGFEVQEDCGKEGEEAQWMFCGRE